MIAAAMPYSWIGPLGGLNRVVQNLERNISQNPLLGFVLAAHRGVTAKSLRHDWGLADMIFIRNSVGNFRCPTGLFCRLLVDVEINRGHQPPTDFTRIVWALFQAGF